jgi:hypothetical protein
MDKWKIHAAYAIGILAFLLVCSLAIEWQSVSDLPEIIAFALSFASLILAVLAIVQSLNSGSALAGILTTIQNAASEIRQSASQVTEKAASVVSATETHTTELSGIRETLANQIPKVAEGAKRRDDSSQIPSVDEITKDNTNGGDVALYLAARLCQNGRSASGLDVLPDDAEFAAYVTGYIAALITSGLIDGNIRKGAFQINSIGTDIHSLADRIRSEMLASGNEYLISLLDKIDKFFATPAPAPAPPAV